MGGRAYRTDLRYASASPSSSQSRSLSQDGTVVVVSCKDPKAPRCPYVWSMPELLCFVAFSSLRRFDAGPPSFSGDRFDPIARPIDGSVDIVSVLSVVNGVRRGCVSWNGEW